MLRWPDVEWDGSRPGDTGGSPALESHSSELHARKRCAQSGRSIFNQDKHVLILCSTFIESHIVSRWYALHIMQSVASGWFWKTWDLGPGSVSGMLIPRDRICPLGEYKTLPRCIGFHIPPLGSERLQCLHWPLTTIAVFLSSIYLAMSINAG